MGTERIDRNTSLTLLVLAAGMGSRYGGIKQMDPVGQAGEFVLDYSVYDAWRAGFNRVVFVIREELEAPLREHFGDRLEQRLEVAYVNQRLEDLPPGFDVPPERAKPWGTGHAVWSAREAIDGPFGVINADDFYGPGAYRLLADFLRSAPSDANGYCMVAYRLANTLSPHGSVARGICTVDENNLLRRVVERTAIELTPAGPRFQQADGSWGTLTGEEPASLNLWGFNASIFAELARLFKLFLTRSAADPKAEFFIPTVVDTLIKEQRCRTTVLQTDEHWFGMTYQQDRQRVVEEIRARIEAGIYGPDLWG